MEHAKPSSSSAPRRRGIQSEPLLTALIGEHRSTLVAMLEPLVAYDRARRTHLLETLEAYVRAGLSIQKTARVLGIHRHTVDYRLKRIQTVMGTRLAMEDRIVIELAFFARTLPERVEETPRSDAAPAG